jgi:uncharacterized membrane protein YdbT with pleckstrin-like domain
MRKHYYINRERVEIVTGLFSRSSREIHLGDIRTITVTRKGIAGLLGVGNITFSSSTDTKSEVTFTGVFRPGSLKSMVRRLQREVPGTQAKH